MRKLISLVIVFALAFALLAPGCGRDTASKQSPPSSTGDTTTIGPSPGQPLDLTSGPLEVHFIDVGQGDSILVRMPDGKTLLIDGGPRSAGQKLVSYLKKAGITAIDIVIGTHPHEDHIGGLISVMNSFHVEEVIDPAVVHTTKAFEDYLTIIDAKEIRFTEGRAGMNRDLGGGARLEILHPRFPSSSHLNDASVVAKLTYGNVSFLFTGDAEEKSEIEMLSGSFDKLRSTILKVGHHGSRTSTSPAFLEAVSPELAVICVGKGNTYGHPHQETLKKLSAAGVAIYRTDLHGSIIIITDGQDYSIRKTGIKK